MIQPSSSKKNESPKIVNLNNEDLCNVEKTISKNQTKCDVKRVTIHRTSS